jgi:hypothetical protein
MSKSKKAVEDRDARINALQAALEEAANKQPQVVHVPVQSQKPDVDVSAVVAHAVAEAKAQAEADKIAAIQQAVDAVKKQAQDALTKKRQQRISIITTANVPCPVTAAPPGPTHHATPFKPAFSEADVTDDGDNNTDDDIVPSKFVTAKGTPAKVKLGRSISDTESDAEGSDDEWTDGQDAFASKPLFDIPTSSAPVKPILKQSSSRVESLRNIARSLSVYGSNSGPKSGAATDMTGHPAKPKKKVTFISPVGSGGQKRDRDCGDAVDAVPMAPVEDSADENYAPFAKKLTSSSTSAARVPTLATKRTKILG